MGSLSQCRQALLLAPLRPAIKEDPPRKPRQQPRWRCLKGGQETNIACVCVYAYFVRVLKVVDIRPPIITISRLSLDSLARTRSPNAWCQVPVGGWLSNVSTRKRKSAHGCQRSSLEASSLQHLEVQAAAASAVGSRCVNTARRTSRGRLTMLVISVTSTSLSSSGKPPSSSCLILRERVRDECLCSWSSWRLCA